MGLVLERFASIEPHASFDRSANLARGLVGHFAQLDQSAVGPGDAENGNDHPASNRGPLKVSPGEDSCTGVNVINAFGALRIEIKFILKIACRCFTPREKTTISDQLLIMIRYLNKTERRIKTWLHSPQSSLQST